MFVRCALLLGALIVGCTSGGDAASTDPVDAGACPPGSALTYDSFGEAFVREHCLGCHLASEEPTLTTQAQVQANRQRMLELAVYSTVMPDDGPLTAEQRQQLGEWLECGAP